MTVGRGGEIVSLSVRPHESLRRTVSNRIGFEDNDDLNVWHTLDLGVDSLDIGFVPALACIVNGILARGGTGRAVTVLNHSSVTSSVIFQGESLTGRVSRKRRAERLGTFRWMFE